MPVAQRKQAPSEPRQTPSTGPGDAPPTARPLLFQPLRLRDLELPNRIVVSPMCQYSCERQDGLATEWHLVHLGTRAMSGVGLVMTEATAVTPEGRISPEDLGLWSDAHADALAPIVRFAHGQGAWIGIQLAHAGRKASTARPWEGHGGVPDERGGWTPIAPSALAYADSYRAPREMTLDDVEGVKRAFAEAATRANRVGFDVLEIHGAHGYLLHQFLSPLANHRSDRYGGRFENRTRLLVEVVDAVRATWPAGKPLFVRLSATDWVSGGWDVEQTVRLSRMLAEHGVDLIDCSSGGLSPAQQIVAAPGYQVPFAERVRREAGVRTGAVGLITDARQAEEILWRGQADVVIMARQLLRDPFFPFHAAAELGVPDAVRWPPQYERAKRSPA